MADTTPAPAQPDLVTRLSAFALDLTALAARGELLTAYGRDREVGELIASLTAPSGLFPALVGEARVGKTAVAHEIARRLARGDVGDALRGARMFEVTPARLLTALSRTGSWRSNLANLLAELDSEPGRKIVLLIRDINTASGIGMAGKDGDGPDLLGTLLDLLQSLHPRIIVEMRSHWPERLASPYPLAEQLFTRLAVTEPEAEASAAIIKAAADDLEIIHDTRIDADARSEAIELAWRFHVYERLPGSAIDLLSDALSARAAGAVLTRDLVLARYAARTGLPEFLVSDDAAYDEAATRAQLTERVYGQETAVEAVLRVIALGRARMNNPNRPMGVFLFLGPTGVGKTELVKALARVLYGDPSRIVRFNLSDFQSDRSVFNFFGFPYSDSEEQRRGQLSNRLRQQLFTVLLLDEFEKGNPGIAPRLLQLFDEGILVDGDGDQVNLRNTIIVLTSNLGARAVDHRIGFSPLKSMDAIEHEVMKVSEETFRPEFINRLDAVCFFKPLSRQVIRQIARREAQAVIDRDGVRRHRLRVSIDESVIDTLSERGYDPRFGARYLSRQVERNITYPLARQIARRRVEPGSTVRLMLRNGEIVVTVVGAETPGDEPATQTGSAPPATEKRLTARERRGRLETARLKLAAIAESMDIPTMRERISATMARVGEPDFWTHSAEATARLDALNTQSQILDQYDALAREVDALGSGSPARRGLSAGDDVLPALEREIFWLELSLQLREPTDQASAFLTLRPISGTDAPDVEWTRELTGMYKAWAESRGYGVTVLNEVGLNGASSAAPIEVTLAIAGHGAYALLKGETGTHRLVRPAGRDPAIRLTVLARVEARPDLPAPREAGLKVSARPIREISALGERLNREITLSQADGGGALRLRGRAADEEIEELARRFYHAKRASADANPLPAPDDGLIVSRDLVRTYSRFKGQSVKDAKTGQVSHRLAGVLAGDLTEFLMARLIQASEG